MTNEQMESAIEEFVEAVNQVGEEFRILSQYVDEPSEVHDRANPPYNEYIKTHDPWDRSFVIWWAGKPATIAQNFFDQWSVTSEPEEGVIERPNVYAKLVGGERGLVPKLSFEPAGEETTAHDLSLQPLAHREDLFRAVSDAKTPIPDVELQVWDHCLDQPAVDAYRYFSRGDDVRIIDSGKVGKVLSVGGRHVTVDIDGENGYTNVLPSEVESVE